MNSDQMQGKWKQLKGTAKEKWGKLTDDDLEVIAGQRDKLVGKLQERYGYAREDAQKRADDWLQTINEPMQAQPQAPFASKHDVAEHSGKR